MQLILFMTIFLFQYSNGNECQKDADAFHLCMKNFRPKQDHFEVSKTCFQQFNCKLPPPPHMRQHSPQLKSECRKNVEKAMDSCLSRNNPSESFPKPGDKDEEENRLKSFESSIENLPNCTQSNSMQVHQCIGAKMMSGQSSQQSFQGLPSMCSNLQNCSKIMSPQCRDMFKETAKRSCTCANDPQVQQAQQSCFSKMTSSGAATGAWRESVAPNFMPNVENGPMQPNDQFGSDGNPNFRASNIRPNAGINGFVQQNPDFLEKLMTQTRKVRQTDGVGASQTGIMMGQSGFPAGMQGIGMGPMMMGPGVPQPGTIMGQNAGSQMPDVSSSGGTESMMGGGPPQGFPGGMQGGMGHMMGGMGGHGGGMGGHTGGMGGHGGGGMGMMPPPPGRFQQGGPMAMCRFVQECNL